MVYLHGGYGNTFAKIEAALEGQEKGYQTTVELQPQDAFGERDESLVQTIPKSEFPPGVKVGGTLKGQDETGHERALHGAQDQGRQGAARRQPSDGRQDAALHACGSTTCVPPRAVEIEHGHVHGEHGHHH